MKNRKLVLVCLVFSTLMLAVVYFITEYKSFLVTASVLPSENLAAAIKTRPDLIYAPILVYHHIASRKTPDPYFVSPQIFAQQMEWLKNNGYNVVSYSQFYGALFGSSTLPAKPVVITFDDGDKDQYENAFPVLKKYGYPAIFFIETRLIRASNWMNWSMLHELISSGMEIGSHTVNHPDLSKLDAKTIDYELSASKQVLEKNLKIPIRFFAYPGGAYSTTTLAELKINGYKSAVTTRHWIWHSKKESPYLVPRIHIDDDLQSFISRVKGINLN